MVHGWGLLKLNTMKNLFLIFLIPFGIYSQTSFNVSNSTYVTSSSQIVFTNCDVVVDGTLSVSDTVQIINGHFTLNGDLISNSSSFYFYNDTTHDYYIYSNNTCNFYNLIVDGGTSSSSDLHLSGDIGVTNHLDIRTQKINLDGSTIDFGSTGHLFNEDDGQHIYDPNYGNGYITASGTIGSNAVFNLGNLGLEITTHANQMGYTTVKRYYKNTDIGSGLYSINRIFEVTPTYNGSDYGGNLNVDIRFLFFNDILNSNDLANLKLYRSGDYGATWEFKGGIVGTNDLTYAGFSNFSQITLAPDNTALPVELSYFEGYNKNRHNILKWSTESENNSDYFLLERSEDGFNWGSIGYRDASNYSQSKIDYNFSDDLYKPTINYYKLNQVDNDGKSKIYGPITIDNRINNKVIRKYTNLLGQEINEINNFGVTIVIYEDGTSQKIIK